ncbi:hypothetical protein [Xylocopilactobacillus apicola]|uniref:Uncharacterized protein n=1 Tax=Xylocopilactobacillus apicola TaxID=2932184 RepID=A0AAU9DLD5_9LACO|nr:hypothetical protein [Xylocopilactobacillus apicola]BDR57702.1 hypothetical protein XA3_01430 [Xylocopilactobacillus apicola]
MDNLKDGISDLNETSDSNNKINKKTVENQPLIKILQRLSHELMPENIAASDAFQDLRDYFKDRNNDEPLELAPIRSFVLNINEAHENGDTSGFINALRKAIDNSDVSEKEMTGLKELLDNLDLTAMQVKRIDLNKQINEQEKKLNEIQNQATEFEAKLTNIYLSFIGILGLFSALIFALFGGFKSAMDAVVHATKISRILVSASVLGIVMVCVVFIFFRFLNKLLHPQTMNPKVSNIDVAVGKKHFRLPNISKSGYPEFSWSIMILAAMLILGILLSIIRL